MLVKMVGEARKMKPSPFQLIKFHGWIAWRRNMAKDGVPQTVKLYQDFGSVEFPKLPLLDDDEELMIDDEELTEGDDVAKSAN